MCTVLLSAASEILKYITVGKGAKMSRIDIIRVILVASHCVESSIRGWWVSRSGFGCFVGGIGIDKEPSGFAVHLISFRNSSETSDIGVLSMPKKNHETHHHPYETFNTARINQDDSDIFFFKSSTKSIGWLCRRVFWVFYLSILIKTHKIPNKIQVKLNKTKRQK